ncbi:BCK1_4 [Sanghuangporus sanghuang]
MTHNLYSFTKSSEVTGIRGTSRWLAYELLSEPEKYKNATRASDTWAYGMTVYEMLTKGYPYAHIKFEGQVLASIVNRKLPQLPEALHEERRKQLWKICTLCWAWDPSERPTMAEVKNEINRPLHLDTSRASGSLSQRDHTWAEGMFEEVTASKDEITFAILDTSVGPIRHTSKPIKWQKGVAISLGIRSNVHLAINMSSGKSFVVKQVKIKRFIVLPHRERTIDAVKELKLESDILKDLDHPNIVKYLGSGRTNKILSIFMEFVPDGSITTHLKIHGKFEDPIARFLARGILSGLVYLHACGVIHGDLSSDNILVDGQGTCKICDFSDSKRVMNTNELIQVTKTPVRGSAWSLAPEVTRQASLGAPHWYNCKVDIWSLGYVVLEMWAGRPDWTALNPFRPCLADDPHERPTAAELLKHTIPPGWKFRSFN